MPAQLLALSEGPSILLDKPILLFGRDLECDVRFDSRKISRKHCCIAQVSDYLVVRDLGSTNGIRINGVRVLEGRLRPGDELTVGNVRYQVRWDEQAVAPRRLAEAARPQPADATAPAHDDAMLEMCDEPVPLSESMVVGNLPEARPVAPSNHDRPPTGKSNRPSPILPDHLSLAPATDSALRRAEQGPAA